MRQLAIAVAIGAGILTLTVCDKIAGPPPLPADAVQFSPPAAYATWWDMTRACSGLNGSLSAVTWYQTSEVVHDTRTGDVIAGYWVASGNRIVLTTDVMLDGGIVRHEMLHALLQKPGHSRDQFLGKCAGTVACEDECVLEAGPYTQPPETPLHVNGDGIQLGVDVEPNPPARNVEGGLFSVTVTARNLSTHWVTVSPSSGTDAGQTFSIDVHGTNGATAFEQPALDPSQTIFAPGETKRQVFDLVIGDAPFGNQLPPGDYTVRGGFAGWWSADNALTIDP